MFIAVVRTRSDAFGIQPLSAVSRLIHGTAGAFDVNLPLTGTPGIECRQGRPSGNYLVVLTFAAPVTFRSATLTVEGTGSISSTSGSGTNQISVNLTNVSNVQTITVKLLGVSDGVYANDIAVPMGILIGDIDASGRVDSTDVFHVRQKSLQSTNGSNFRDDVDESGRIDSTDVFIVRQDSLTALAYTRFMFTLDASYQTSAGVFSNGNLIRTLWRKVRYGPGTIVACWDGDDDNGVPVKGRRFEIRLLYHTVQYVWDGVIGNTSSATNGATPHRGSTFMQSLAIDGSNAFYAIGECEGFNPVSHFATGSDQSQNSILLPDALTRFDLLATDGTRIYMADSGSSGEQTFNTFVIAHNVSDNMESSFTSGTSATRLQTYSSCIDVDTYTPSPTPTPDPMVNPKRPTGLAVQKSGSVLAVAHAGLNLIRLFNKTSGALLSQSVSVSAPQGLATDSNGHLWVITGNSLKRYSDLDTTPTLVQTITGFTAPIAVAVHPSNPDIVLVADGGTSQIVRAFNRSATSVNQALWTYGLPGGYSTNGPGVTNTKLQFQVGPKSTPIYHCALAVASDGSFWVGDGATERLLHVKSDRSGTIDTDTIMFLAQNASLAVDPNYPRRVIGDDFLEFDVDYTKPLQQAWTLKKNWAAGLSQQYLGPNGIQVVSTLSQNNRVYGTIRDFSSNRNPHRRIVVELPATGNLRICKDSNNNNLQLPLFNTAPHYYGSSWQDYPAFAADGSLRYHRYSSGPTVSWFKKPLSSFDGSGNPQWGRPVLLASAPYRDSDPVGFNEAGGSTGNNSMPITSSGVIISFVDHRKNRIPRGRLPDSIPATGWHLGGIPIGAKQWQWRASPIVTSDVPFDGMGSFDLGDGVNYTGSIAMAMGRNVIYGYPGEFWHNGSEASQWIHFYDDGLFVGQFGITGDYQHIGMNSLIETILPGFSGNAFFSSLVGVGSGNSADPNGDVYLWANDESQHSAIHRWHILGANTIREQTGSVALGGIITLSGVSASFPTVLSGVPGNAQVSLSWTAGAGVSSYDVKQSTISGGPYTKIGSTSNTSHSVSGLTNGTSYYFAVSANGSTVNSNEVEAWPFITLGKAGMLRGGFDPSRFQVNSLAVSRTWPSLVDLNNVFGNLTRTNVGTNGYVFYDASGPNGGDNVNLHSGFTVTRDSGWASQSNINVKNRFDVDGKVGLNNAIFPNLTGGISINIGGATGVHYLTVFCPSFADAARSFTIALTPTGQASPSITYAVSEPDGTRDLLIYQFEFTGNVTLTATATGGIPHNDCVQAVFLD